MPNQVLVEQEEEQRKQISTPKFQKAFILMELPSIGMADVEVIFQLSSLSKAEHFDPKWTNPQKLCEHKGADVKGGVGPFGLLTLASAMREEHTAVYFTVFKAPNKYVALLCHDPSRSTIRPGLYKPTFGGWVDADIQRNGKISMRNLGGTLYTTLTADSHSIFLELLRLFFNGSTEFHFANFLHMVTTMAESGSTSENILNSQKIPVGEYPMAATVPYGSEKYAVGEYPMAATVNNPNLEASSKTKNELNDSVLFSRPERDRLCYQTHYDDNQFWKTGRLCEAIAYNFFISKLGPENVKWVNEGNETGLPYDLIIGVDESSKEYIEVKATRSATKD